MEMKSVVVSIEIHEGFFSELDEEATKRTKRITGILPLYVGGNSRVVMNDFLNASAS
jgi:hypothetical protein